MKLVHHVTGEVTGLEACLHRHLRLKRPTIQNLLRLGAIYQNDQRLFEDCELPVGTHLRIYTSPSRFPVSGIRWRDCIFHEEREFLVVNKPPGVPSHATPDNFCENLLFQMRSLLGPELWITQRLDTPVSGLMLLAKTKGFQASFNERLRKGGVTKIYQAETESAPPLGKHVHYMEPSSATRKRVDLNPHEGWDRCELEVLENEPRVKIQLHTGRTHQIRAQLAALGAPIVGDRKYGATTSFDLGAIALASTELSFGKHHFTLYPM